MPPFDELSASPADFAVEPIRDFTRSTSLGIQGNAYNDCRRRSMTNHFHMALQTGDVHIARIMQRILSDYAVYFNHRYACSGHVFEGRYTSSLIDSETYFLEVSRHIHLNPVKAGMAREPLAYDYSSYELMVTEGSGSFCRNRFKTALSELVDTSRVRCARRWMLRSDGSS